MPDMKTATIHHRIVCMYLSRDLSIELFFVHASNPDTIQAAVQGVGKEMRQCSSQEDLQCCTDPVRLAGLHCPEETDLTEAGSHHPPSLLEGEGSQEEVCTSSA